MNSRLSLLCLRALPLSLLLLLSSLSQLRGWGIARKVLTSASIPSRNLYSSLHPPSLQLTPEEENIGNIARQAAWKAGKFILAGSGSIDLNADVESKIGSRDIVTQVDKDCQNVIEETILSHFPDHKFLGEEDVPPGREASQKAIEKLKEEAHLWIVDPVDGTTNFAHGMPLCGVIIAYASYGVVKFGMIYDPFRNETFVAWKGKGAYLNGQRLRCCNTNALSSSVVCTGSPPNFESLSACMRGMHLLSAQVRSMRVLGSACVHLAWLAAGRITGYFEADLNAWDLVAGALIVSEAGGKVTDVWGKEVELTTRNTVASNGIIHYELIEKLREAKMWMD
jgi:myo-inositol-1(or 4)-monophosphatase